MLVGNFKSVKVGKKNNVFSSDKTVFVTQSISNSYSAAGFRIMKLIGFIQTTLVELRELKLWTSLLLVARWNTIDELRFIFRWSDQFAIVSCPFYITKDLILVHVFKLLIIYRMCIYESTLVGFMINMRLFSSAHIFNFRSVIYLVRVDIHYRLADLTSIESMLGKQGFFNTIPMIHFHTCHESKWQHPFYTLNNTEI